MSDYSYNKIKETATLMTTQYISSRYVDIDNVLEETHDPKIKEIYKKEIEYLDYIKDHYYNVQQAFHNITNNTFQKDTRKLGYEFDFIGMDLVYWCLQSEISRHDISKLSDEEFYEYRKCFYPTPSEPKIKLGEAWEHHQKHNSHHWQTWMKKLDKNGWSNEIYIDIIHNFIDWYAMSMKNGGRPLDYYRKNKDTIKIKYISIFEEIEEALVKLNIIN